MWHEARRQEKKIRCMLVDYQRRAQRRKDFYEKIKADPTQFLQLHGRPCKIHLDPTVVAAATSPATMMPWQGNPEVMIDRFDVRAHLDVIPENKSQNDIEKPVTYDERQINYERYRILVQNDFFGIPEEKFLHQIYLEEKFGSTLLKNTEESKKKSTGVAIGFNYEADIDKDDLEEIGTVPSQMHKKGIVLDDLLAEDVESDEEVDLDLTIDIKQIEVTQANELNAHAHSYGMQSNDFFSFLSSDVEEQENLKLVRAHEEEKALVSGRKSRKERRAFKEKILAGRILSPPSYASRKSPSYDDYKALVKSRSRSKSRSLTPENKITYITSFGEEDVASANQNVSAAPVSHKSKSTRHHYRTRRSESTTKERRNRSRSASRKRRYKERNGKNLRSRSREKKRHKRRSRTRTRSRSRSQYRLRSRSSSRSKLQSKRISRSVSRCRSKSLSRSKSRHKSRSISSSVSSCKSRSISRRKSRSISWRRSRSISRRRSRSKSRHKSRSRSWSRRKSRSWSRGRSRSRPKKRSRSRSRRKSFTRSRKGSRTRSKQRSTSHSRWTSKTSSRSRSRSRNSRNRRQHDTASRSRSRSRSSGVKHSNILRKVSKRRSTSKPVESLNQTTEAGRSVSSTGAENSAPIAQAQPAIPRYYGRNKRSSSSELSMSSSDEKDSTSKPAVSALPLFSAPKLGEKVGVLGGSGAHSKVGRAGSKLTPQELLKRKRQVLLNRQYKADKRAEKEKIKKMVQERIDRAEEIKEIAIKIRRRNRRFRHEVDDDSLSRRSSSSDGSYRRRSRSTSYSDSPASYRRSNKRGRHTVRRRSNSSDRSKSRSRSKSNSSRAKNNRSRSNSLSEDGKCRKSKPKSVSPREKGWRKSNSPRIVHKDDTLAITERSRYSSAGTHAYNKVHPHPWLRTPPNFDEGTSGCAKYVDPWEQPPYNILSYAPPGYDNRGLDRNYAGNYNYEQSRYSSGSSVNRRVNEREVFYTSGGQCLQYPPRPQHQQYYESGGNYGNGSNEQRYGDCRQNDRGNYSGGKY